MSTRQPFVPQRPSNNADQNTNSNARLVLTESQSQNQMDLAAPTNKPLNISGLIKPKSSRKQQQNHQSGHQAKTSAGTPTLKSHGSFEGIQRPPQPAIFTKNHGSIKSRMSNNSMQQNQPQVPGQDQNQSLMSSPFFSNPNKTSAGVSNIPSNTPGPFIRSPSFQLAPSSISNPSNIASANSGNQDAHMPTFAQGSTESAMAAMTPVEKNQEPTSPFRNGNRPKENLKDSVDRGQTSSLPSDVGSVGSTGLGFGVAVSGGITSLGPDVAIGTDSGRSKRNRAEEQDEESDELNEEYVVMAMKKQKVDGGPQISTSKRNASVNLNTHQHYYRESSPQNQDLEDVDEGEHEHDGQQHINHPRQHEHEHSPAASRPQAPAQPHLLAIFVTAHLNLLNSGRVGISTET